jgi:hypothetical protein
MELPFAALHQLCGPMLNRLDRLRGPLRDALGVAFGMSSGSVPGRFLIGLAVLGVLSDAGAGRPLLCLIDDAQWLDQAAAQALVALCLPRTLSGQVTLHVRTRGGFRRGGRVGGCRDWYRAASPPRWRPIWTSSGHRVRTPTGRS